MKSKIADSFGSQLRKFLTLKGWKLVDKAGIEVLEEEYTGIVGICQLLTKHINWSAVGDAKQTAEDILEKLSN